MHIILTHEQADFDALGALLGAALLNEQACALLPHRLNRNARAFLNLYGAELPFIELQDLPAEPIESVTLVDTQSLVTLKGVTARTQIFVIDHHHIRPGLPKDWQVKTDQVGSCTTLLVENLYEFNGQLTDTQASLLLMGIYEDTGSLGYGSTTPRDVRAAAFLLEHGASLHTAFEYLNPPLSLDQRKLYDRLLSVAEAHLVNGQNILLACAGAEDMMEEISSVGHKLRDLLEPDALFLLVTTREGLRLVARSTTDRVNVSAVAAQFGGGGHERAAAALLKRAENQTAVEQMEGARQTLLSILPGLIRPSITVGEIMSGRPSLLAPDTTAKEAAAKMQRYGYEGFPVVEGGKVIGLLTRRAVDRAINHNLPNLPAGSLMEAGKVSISPHESIETLHHLMTTTGWGQVPVVDPDKGSVIGIVTRTDLLKTLSGGEPRSPGRENISKSLETALSPARLALLRLIADQAHEGHLPVYIVGGFVRDVLLNRTGQDFDIVVEGDAIALARSLAARFGGRVVSHTRFGTAKWKIKDIRENLAHALSGKTDLHAEDLPESPDLISARTEFYEYPTALPTVERSGIKHDLHRRDFTFNTLAMRLDGRHFGDLYDYWGGLSDLRKGLVRVLHSLSFVDDPTRMLRAVRFEQRFHFQIEERTLQLIAEAREMLSRVSGERLRHELDLILGEERPVDVLARLQDLGLLSAIFPGLDWSGKYTPALQKALSSIDSDLADCFGSLPAAKGLAYLVWFVSLIGGDSREVALRLRFPASFQKILDAALLLLRDLPALEGASPSRISARFAIAPKVSLTALSLLDLPVSQKELIRKYQENWRFVAPATDGLVLATLGLPPGPHYRRIIEELRAAWLDGAITTHDEENLYREKLIADIKSNV